MNTKERQERTVALARKAFSLAYKAAVTGSEEVFVQTMIGAIGLLLLEYAAAGQDFATELAKEGGK